MDREYTEEEKTSPWEYGEISSSEGEEESDYSDNKPVVQIPESLKRPGGSILRSLVPDGESIDGSSFSQYSSERMRETFQVERLEDSTIEYVVRTTSKFLEFTSRNKALFPDNDGINHHVRQFHSFVHHLIVDDHKIRANAIRRRGERLDNHKSSHLYK